MGLLGFQPLLLEVPLSKLLHPQYELRSGQTTVPLQTAVGCLLWLIIQPRILNGKERGRVQASDTGALEIMHQRIMALLHIATDYICLNTLLTHTYICTLNREVK